MLLAKLLDKLEPDEVETLLDFWVEQLRDHRNWLIDQIDPDNDLEIAQLNKLRDSLIKLGGLDAPD